MNKLSSLNHPNPVGGDFHPITEVFIPQGQNSNSIIFPLVASLSGKNSNRWLSWITHRQPTKQDLLLLGANQKNLRIIHTKQDMDNRWLMWEALAQGSSHTVVCDLNKCHKSDISDMETAAAQGQSFGIIIKSSLNPNIS
ncbi:MAG: hypothetical protein KTR20_08820 [Cellvibrionaceae bacterium]|nr:hypothetical protein [Cellvibrionaceae bacterium]